MRTAGLNDGISYRIGKVSSVFGRLDKRFFSRHNISLHVKVRIYRTCALLSLIYGSETGIVYHRHLRHLERDHQCYFWKILGINWKIAISDVVVLERSGSSKRTKSVMEKNSNPASYLWRPT